MRSSAFKAGFGTASRRPRTSSIASCATAARARERAGRSNRHARYAKSTRRALRIRKSSSSELPEARASLQDALRRAERAEAEVEVTRRLVGRLKKRRPPAEPCASR
ncbi:hypothetical protein CIW54_08960 [Paraburkholderia sp. T12-10]|nr:hypothetical protein CIW54_08960 [Paraburkholderia sp. T12-10]